MTIETTSATGFVASTMVPLADPSCRAVQMSLVGQLTGPKYRPPILPVIAVQLMETARKPSVTMREIAALIEQDPVLAAAMLKLTHSAILALSSPIRTVEEALVRLGIRRSTELFIQAALKSKLFRCRGYEGILERLRRHSVATAEISRLLCETANLPEQSFYLTGLLHDVGIAGCILALGSRGSYLPPPPFEQAWPAIHGIHRGFALHLATKWQLPKEIRHGISQHFDFQVRTNEEPLGAITGLAEMLAQRVGLGFQDEAADDPSGDVVAKAIKQLGLSDAQLDAVLREAGVLAERLQ